MPASDGRVGRASATALFNVVGKRIAAAGVGGLPDTYDMPRNVLDLSTSVPVRGAISLKVDAKNLLDAPYLVRQGAGCSGADTRRVACSPRRVVARLTLT